MIIKLVGADFSQSNIGTLSTWSIIKRFEAGVTLTNPAKLDPIDRKGTSPTPVTITVDKTNYTLDAVSITMGGVDVKTAWNYAESNGTITFTIPAGNALTGNIEIDIDTTPISVEEPETTYYTITYVYIDGSGATVKASTTEQVAAGTVKNFATTDSRATVSGYTCNSVSPTNATVNSNITITYTYTVVSDEDAPTNLKTYPLTWEAGGLDVNQGHENTTSNRRRTDYIPIEYVFAKRTSTANVFVVYYDSNKNYLTPTSETTTKQVTVTNDWSNILTYMPEGASYFRIMATTGDETQDSAWESLRNTIIEVANMTEKLDWEAGGFVVTSGALNNALDILTSRRRTIYHIPISYKTINISGSSVSGFAIYYDNVGNYLGTTMKDGNVSAFSIANNGTYDVSTQAPVGTAYYKIMCMTGDSAQDAYWSFSK